MSEFQRNCINYLMIEALSTQIAETLYLEQIYSYFNGSKESLFSRKLHKVCDDWLYNISLLSIFQRNCINYVMIEALSTQLAETLYHSQIYSYYNLWKRRILILT